MNILVIIGSLAAFAGYTIFVYFTGRNSSNGELEARDIKIEKLIVDKANLRSENNKLHKQLQEAINKPDADDLDNILQSGEM